MSNIYEAQISEFAKRMELFQDSVDVSNQVMRICDEADGIMRNGDRYYLLEAADSFLSLHKECLKLLLECERVKKVNQKG